MARCPSVVKINGYKWRINSGKRHWETLRRADDCVGVTFEQYSMAVKPGVMDVQDEAATVLHEILHAVYRHSFPPDIREEPRDQEDVIGGIELALYSVVRDNPRLLAYLQSPEPL